MKLFLTALLSVGIAFATSLTGTLKGPDGTGANGVLSFTLSQQASLVSSGGCGGPLEILPLRVAVTVVAGAMQSAPSLYGNDCLLPQGTYYNITFKDNQGNTIMTDRWTLSGSSVDIGTIVSVVVSGTTQLAGAPGVILTAPTTNQSVVQPSGTALSIDRLIATVSWTFPNGTVCTVSGCSGGLSFSSAVALNGGLSIPDGTNSNIVIGTSGNLYLRTFTGTASCSGVADGWAAIRTDTFELQVCIGGALKKVTLN
jgi:hypothetical protein